MTEMFDYFSHQYQLYIAALSTTTGKYSTPRPPSPHNIEVLKHTVPFIEEFKEDFHCLSHINSLGENGFLEPLVAMTRCVLALIFSNEDVDKKLFFDAMTSLLYIFNQLFITDDNVKLFLKDFSNIYPTVILKFRELEDVSPSTTEIAEKIIEKVYTLAKSIDMNSPFVRTLKALRQLKKRTNTNPTTGSTYNNTNNNSIINSNSIVGRGSIGNGKNGMAYQFAPINSNTSPYRTPSSAVNYGVNNAANMKPLNLDDVKLNSSTGGAGIDDNNLPSAVTHKVSNEAKNLDDIEKQITEIQLQQCQISLNNFELIRFIGKGGCGTVFLAKAKNLPGGETYLALKVIDQSDFEVQKRLQRYKIERNLMVLISNPFIITLHYAFITSNYLYLALQYCNGGDLYHYLSRMPNYRISENDARFYASEVLLALECLHAYNYMYRDLKPENILISHTGHIVLGDFDLSMSTDINNDNKLNLTGEKSLVGTLEYISPEVAQGLEYDERTDWWSFGILIYEMIYGKVPFEGQGHELLVNICNDDIPFPYLSKKCFTHKSVSNAMKDIVTKLLDKNHEERLSDPDIIKNHPFFQKIDFENILTMVPPYVPPPEVPEEYTKSRIDIHDEGLPRKSDTFIRIDGMWSTVALDTPPTRQNRKLK